jgi:hypothetical protein
MQPACQLEVVVPELTQIVGEMRSLFCCSSPMALNQGPSSRDKWPSWLGGAALLSTHWLMSMSVCGTNIAGCSDFSKEARNHVFMEKLTTYTY